MDGCAEVQQQKKALKQSPHDSSTSSSNFLLDAALMALRGAVARSSGCTAGVTRRGGDEGRGAASRWEDRDEEEGRVGGVSESVWGMVKEGESRAACFSTTVGWMTEEPLWTLALSLRGGLAAETDIDGEGLERRVRESEKG